MNCGETEKISSLIDEELHPAEAQAMKRHLAECSECRQAQEDFLNLRTQIVALPRPRTAVTNPALSKILGGDQNATTGWRNRIPATLAPSYFQPRFAAALAVILAVVIIGGVVFLRQPSSDLVSKTGNSDQAEIVDEAAQSGSSSGPAPQGQPPKNVKPKGTKGTLREGRRPKALDNKNPKPDRERSMPNRPPQTRNDAPPTYAMADENLSNPSPTPPHHADTLAVQHLEQSELLLRSFRNARSIRKGAVADIAHERKRAQQLFYQNVLLRREADTSGDIQLSALLGSLEPILLDIANLRDKPRQEEVVSIKERMERKSLVALLQINSSALARANE